MKSAFILAENWIVSSDHFFLITWRFDILMIIIDYIFEESHKHLKPSMIKKSVQHIIDRYKNVLGSTRNLQIRNETFSNEVIRLLEMKNFIYLLEM